MKMLNNLKFLAPVIFSLSCCLLGSTAQAAVMLKNGLTQEHNVSAGQTITGVLELQNVARAPGEVKISLQDDVADGAQGKTRSNRAWIRLPSDRIILAPGASQKVSYTIQIPPGVGQGSYWSALYIEPVSNNSRESELAQLPPTEPGKMTIQIIQKLRYQVQIITHIGNGNANLIFASPRMGLDTSGKKAFGIDIQNTGNRYTRSTVMLDVFDASGRTVTSLKGEERSLYPGARKRFNVDVSSLRPGSYKALLSAEDSNTGKSFGADVTLDVR